MDTAITLAEDDGAFPPPLSEPQLARRRHRYTLATGIHFIECPLKPRRAVRQREERRVPIRIGSARRAPRPDGGSSTSKVFCFGVRGSLQPSVPLDTPQNSPRGAAADPERRFLSRPRRTRCRQTRHTL